MKALDQILEPVADFPARNVSAALLGPDGTGSLGDVDKAYAVASVTKPVAAYAVMVAVEEGALELDQEASAWGAPEGATVRHLLAHASGVGFDSRTLQKPVGQRRIYSSAGYEILADAVAAETGIEFPEYLRQAVLEPLGMGATYLEGSAGHGLTSTVRDLGAFAREVASPQLLDVSTVDQMFTVQYPGLRGLVPGYGSFKDCQWGLGFEIHGDKDHWMGALPADAAGHFGMSGTYLWLAGEYAMVMLTDHDFGDWAKPLWAQANTAIWQGLAG